MHGITCIQWIFGVYLSWCSENFFCILICIFIRAPRLVENFFCIPIYIFIKFSRLVEISSVFLSVSLSGSLDWLKSSSVFPFVFLLGSPDWSKSSFVFPSISLPESLDWSDGFCHVLAGIGGCKLFAVGIFVKRQEVKSNRGGGAPVLLLIQTAATTNQSNLQGWVAIASLTHTPQRHQKA
ncbi:hypothetical protein BKA61DRAFT_242022 [Leptodontidium sp. MPI-SDFR-AT-0119]|nr:hypothetical protein BKA61DRAFT_242022 [Leptodontidium sp. MPI-SDFR-AT-0119]